MVMMKKKCERCGVEIPEEIRGYAGMSVSWCTQFIMKKKINNEKQTKGSSVPGSPGATIP